LGITVRDLDKLVDVFDLSTKFTNLRDPAVAITWARELMGVSKNLLTPSVIEAAVKKVNQRRITNSKDLRKLRTILRDPVAKAHFLADEGDLESAALRIAPVEKKSELVNELDAAIDAMKQVPWTALHELKGREDVLKRIEEAEALLKNLRNTLAHGKDESSST
jgi:ParB family chromosome partitioning protein